MEQDTRNGSGDMSNSKDLRPRLNNTQDLLDFYTCLPKVNDYTASQDLIDFYTCLPTRWMHKNIPVKL